jgi:hypothetical protein
MLWDTLVSKDRLAKSLNKDLKANKYRKWGKISDLNVDFV